MTARQKWLLTAAVCLSTVFLAAVNSSHGPLLSPMIERYALTDSQQGYPNSAQNIGCIAAMFTSLWVIGRLRKQTLLTAAVGLMALLMLPLSLCRRSRFTWVFMRWWGLPMPTWTPSPLP